MDRIRPVNRFADPRCSSERFFIRFSYFTFSVTSWILALVFLFALMAVQTCSGGVAISGSFYAHDYVLAQGEEISSKDIYIVAFNKADKRVRVDMEYESPEFIEINLSSKGCFLNPDEYTRVYISLKAREDAVPGNYTVKVFAIIKEERSQRRPAYKSSYFRSSGSERYCHR